MNSGYNVQLNLKCIKLTGKIFQYVGFSTLEMYTFLCIF